MAKISLNPIITDIRNRMGSNVFSKWKGINYVRGYVSQTDRKSEDQVAVRSTFSRLVSVWKGLGKVVRESWNAFAMGRNLSGYNAFIGENFENMKLDLGLILSQPMEEEPIIGFAAQPGANAGEISCAYAAPPAEGKAITLLTQKKGANGGTSIMTHVMGNTTPPLTISGLEPGAAYHVYAVVTEGPYCEAKKVSGSVSAEAVAKA